MDARNPPAKVMINVNRARTQICTAHFANNFGVSLLWLFTSKQTPSAERGSLPLVKNSLLAGPRQLAPLHFSQTPPKPLGNFEPPCASSSRADPILPATFCSNSTRSTLIPPYIQLQYTEPVRSEKEKVKRNQHSAIRRAKRVQADTEKKRHAEEILRKASQWDTAVKSNVVSYRIGGKTGIEKLVHIAPFDDFPPQNASPTRPSSLLDNHESPPQMLLVLAHPSLLPPAFLALILRLLVQARRLSAQPLIFRLSYHQS